MIEIEDAALAHHGVVVEVLLQPFPELHRPFVERLIAGQKVVGADDRGVTAGVARADPAFFQHGDIGYAMLFGEIVRRRQSMPAAADNDHVVMRARRGVSPRGRPTPMAGKGVGEEGEGGVAHGAAGPVAATRCALDCCDLPAVVICLLTT